MLALATTRQGDVPLFCQALDGNTSDKVSLVAAVEALAEQLRTEEDERPLFVADSGLYSAENVARLSAAGVRWISRVPDTSRPARAALEVADDAWQQEGDLFWAPVTQTPEGERWVVVRTTPGEERARATLERQVEQVRQEWEKALWHLGHQRCACEPDAQAALAKQLTQRPQWLGVHAQLVAHPKFGRVGRPRQDATPDREAWQIAATLTLNEAAIAREGRRTAAFLVATNVLDPQHLSDQELIQTYNLHSAVSSLGFVEVLVRWSQHLFMQWLEPGNVLLRWPTWRSKSHETTPLEALEDPAHGGSSGRFAHLAGHRLLRRGELFAQAMFGESVHEQTQHHHPAQGDNPLRTRDEDGGGQEQGVFEETEAALHPVLFLVGVDQLLIREHRGVQDVGGDQEARLA